jgi:hypothetical protein
MIIAEKSPRSLENFLQFYKQNNMDDTIKKIFDEIKSRLESSLPFIKSEIKELTKPTLRGNNWLRYSMETENTGIDICFYDNGVFEIMTGLVTTEDGDDYYVSHVPSNYQNEMYSKYDIDLFVEKMNELLASITKDNSSD